MCEFYCKWLPNLILFNDFKDWFEYENYLYEIYLDDFKRNTAYIFNKPIRIRVNPTINEKDQTFFHITSNSDYAKTHDPNDRTPDFRRCERIAWPREIIDNYLCNDECNCNKIKMWKEDYKNNVRIHLLFEDVNFLVVLEERNDYVLFITCFHMEYSHQVKKQLKKYERYKNSQQKTPL